MRKLRIAIEMTKVWNPRVQRDNVLLSVLDVLRNIYTNVDET